VTSPTATATRALPPSVLRRGATAVLVAGTVLSVAASFGPIWVVRGGLAVAIASAVATSLLAWREVSAERRQHASAMLTSSRAHTEALRAERAHNSAVLQVLTGRNTAAMAEVRRQQTLIAQLRGEVCSLKGDRAALTADLARRERTIESLRVDVRAREAELVALLDVDPNISTDLADAEVHTMPRRIRMDGAELIAEPVLPNYEEDRRLA
jgi:hypothetical protein